MDPLARAIRVGFANGGRDGGAAAPAARGTFTRRDKVDCQDQFSPVEFAVFSRPRALRNERAEIEAVPP